MSNARRLAVVAVLTALAGTGCSQEQAVSEPRILEQTAALTPATVPLTIGPLSGELSDLSVFRRVEESSGNTVYPPQLRGTLVLRNTSDGVAVRLVGARSRISGRTAPRSLSLRAVRARPSRSRSTRTSGSIRARRSATPWTCRSPPRRSRAV